MKKEPYFEDVPCFGDLYLEKILFQDECPIFFTLCNSEGEQRFIGVCCEIRGEQRWLVATINTKTIIELLSDDITIREAFEADNQAYISIVWKPDYEKEKYKFYSRFDVPRNDLPSGGVHFQAEGEFDDYIRLLKSLSSEESYRIVIDACDLFQNIENVSWYPIECSEPIAMINTPTNELAYNYANRCYNGIVA